VADRGTSPLSSAVSLVLQHRKRQHHGDGVSIGRLILSINRSFVIYWFFQWMAQTIPAE
jgi:hypothetical protein